MLALLSLSFNSRRVSSNTVAAGQGHKLKPIYIQYDLILNHSPISPPTPPPHPRTLPPHRESNHPPQIPPTPPSNLPKIRLIFSLDDPMSNEEIYNGQTAVGFKGVWVGLEDVDDGLYGEEL